MDQQIRQERFQSTPLVSLSHDAGVVAGFVVLTESQAAADESSHTPPLTADPPSFVFDPLFVSSIASMRGSVFGIGVDVAHIPRFDGVHERHEERFTRKSLAPAELAALTTLPSSSADPSIIASFLAFRWSVKEALVKASGQRLLFPEMTLIHDDGRSCSIQLSGSAKEWSEREKITRIHVSVTRNEEHATAFVVLER